MTHIFRDRVVVGAITFNDNSTDEFGNQFYWDQFGGWSDSAEPRVEVSEYGFSDGVESSDKSPNREQYYEIGGYVRCGTRLAGERAADKLVRLFNRNGDFRVTRYGPIPKSVDVRRVNSFVIPQDVGEAFRWSTRVMAEWPYKISPDLKTQTASAFSGSEWGWAYTNLTSYGRSYDVNNSRPYVLLSGSGAQILYPDIITQENQGTAVAYPITVVHGPLPGRTWSLVNETTGETMTYDLDLSANVDMTIDHREKVAMIGSEDVSYYIRGDWLSLAPGVNNIRLTVSSDNPDAYVTVSFNDTWER